MGMYDDLIIDKVHLPDNLKDYENGWQTKSLDCNLSIIKIDENGNLFERMYNFSSDKQLYDEPIRRYHVGEIRFYQNIIDKWFEFIAFFDDGVMFRLIQIEKIN